MSVVSLKDLKAKRAAMTQGEWKPDRICQCSHRHDEHVRMMPDSVGCVSCSCIRFRPRVFATHRQITGTPYIHHAYVCDGNKVVMSCTHRHGERQSVARGGVTAQACADRMLRKYLAKIKP